MPNEKEPRTPDPTPEEIRDMCEDIREEWDEQTRRKRLARRLADPYTIPTTTFHPSETTHGD